MGVLDFCCFFLVVLYNFVSLLGLWYFVLNANLGFACLSLCPVSFALWLVQYRYFAFSDDLLCSLVYVVLDVSWDLFVLGSSYGWVFWYL